MNRRRSGKGAGEPLSRAESEPAQRAVSVLAQAERAFASKAKAHVWLRRPTSALGDRRPIDLLDEESGRRLVEQLLYRIEHGIAA